MDDLKIGDAKRQLSACEGGVFGQTSKRQCWRTVLGIDAAWTETQPSGVALVGETASGWRLISVADSYQRFHAQADGVEPELRPSGSPPSARALLRSAGKLCGGSVDIVAIDMPLARSPIVGRRAADRAVSQAYGARKCSTHSPSASRPGRISDQLRKQFEAGGFSLCTEDIIPPSLIEVYPHPALVELCGAAERLPYKVGKIRGYWPKLEPSQRRARLFRQWEKLVTILDNKIDGVSEALPPLSRTASGLELKAYEDKLDAIVCAWVGVCALGGSATPFGDRDAAIWIPTPTIHAAAR